MESLGLEAARSALRLDLLVFELCVINEKKFPVVIFVR